MQILATSFALASVIFYPSIAETVSGPPLSNTAEYITVASLLALLAHLTTRTGPAMVKQMAEIVDKIEGSHSKAVEKMADVQRECTTEMAGELKGLRGDMKGHMANQIDLLKSEMIKRPG